MPCSDDYNFVAGDEDLTLHLLFGFNEAIEVDTPFPTINASAPPALGSPFLGPLEDLQGQLDWPSSSAVGPVDGLDAVNFDEFLALDESTNDFPESGEEAAAAPQSELPAISTSQIEPAAAAELPADIPVLMQLEAARDEMMQLKVAMAAEGHQSSSSISPQKRKLKGGELSPPKRQTTTQIGPIEALWSPKVTGDGHSAVPMISTSLPSPKPCSPRPDFTAPSTPLINTSHDCTISPENRRSLQDFLNDEAAPIKSRPHQVDISTPPDDTMRDKFDMKIKGVPTKQTVESVPGTSAKPPKTITKKPRAAPKTQHRRKTSHSADITPPPARSIDELLAANFYGLNAQEKVRVMLPMLRNLHPKELEKNLAMLPCIQAKGAGHEAYVARAIYNSPPTTEADDVLATKLTFGTEPPPTAAARRNPTASPASTVEASPHSRKVARIDTCEDHGAIRQREALEKAAMLQML